ncbi:uncharacterized protein LOC112186795 isoform X2 [Rosa chinensis]|uniref:uncharacterized protein LOC112186795 isoform X2 n=1 Tax=Rosa chinensis TaxID=74649 RepID=UPI000D088D22|nr:uncharacterized protein LOC112186795 isoform X2 [Rosa chinensis]
MAAENARRGIKRFLEQSTSDRVDQGESKCSCVKSKRLKTIFHPEIAGGSNECQNEMQSGDDDQNVSQDSLVELNENNSFQHLPTDVTNRAAKNTKRGRKKFLKQSSGEKVDEGKTESSHVRSKRLKRMFCPSITEGSNECENGSQLIDGDKDSTPGQCRRSFGQASYQRAKQGSTVRYEDFSDNSYRCEHCGARFWRGEAVKRPSSNASITYTNCCRKGEIKLEQAKPTPLFLDNLLNPDNSPESRLFRENIRVYNSMFSFTSMGACIDHKINIGSGLYVFKISG